MKLTNPLELRNVIKLLKGLKSVKAQYPSDLLAARRAQFVKEINATKISIKESKANTLTPNNFGLETILQFVLAGMVSMLIVAAAYVYQDELSDFFLPKSTEVPIISTIPSTQDAFPIIPSSVVTFTPTSTPTPISIREESNPEPTEIKPDPKPTASNPTETNPTETNPGLHLGQTKTPKPKK